MSRKSSDRAYELDTLRGLAMIFVIFMHVSWDLRYGFELAKCSYLLAPWFEGLMHPFFLVVFVCVSGICCTFSRNNVIRGLKLLIVASILTAGSLIATYVLHIEFLIIFNVLHLLTCGIFIYAGVNYIEKKHSLSPKLINALFGFLGAFAIILGTTISNFDFKVDSPILIPLGIRMFSLPAMDDYMPLFPWIGVFMVGVVIGRTCYAEKKTLIPPKSDVTRKITAPFEFIGRHSLIIYIVHQPIVMGICYLISMVVK